MTKIIEKKKAVDLREKGMSIKEISRELGVAKSTVSNWVSDILLSKGQREALKDNQHTYEVIERRRTTRLNNENRKRQALISIAEKDIKGISRKELKLVGAVLYWAEGLKRHRYVSFSNSDPVIIKVMMRFFREVCLVPQAKFRAHIHTHSHLNARAAEKYWSQVTGIDLGQFFKTYSKPSKASKGKADALPYGTLDISIGDITLYLKLMGWISKISKILLK